MILVRAVRWFVAIGGAILCSVLCVLTAFFDRRKRVPYFLNHLLAKFFLPVVGIRLEVTGTESIDLEQNYILCSNHQGLFDIFSLLAIFRRPIRFVSKPAYFRVPIIGRGMRASGHIEITRTDKEKDHETIRRLVEMVRGGESIVMFPEGTRTRDGTVGPFKFGTFLVAIESGIPLLPITIRGSFDRLKKGSSLPTPGTIRVFLHPPIDPRGQTPEALLDKSRESILSKI